MSRSVSYARGSFVIAYETLNVEDEGYSEWDWVVEDIVYRARKVFPSMRDCDQWLGSEDHAILENQFAYLGISEYCGLVSIWMVLKDTAEYTASYSLVLGLAEHWASQVENKFYKTFGTLTKVGTFSNGEAVFKRKGK
jgi:hypothetical protein